MYRALYDYKSKLPQYLSFLGGDKFTVLDGSRSDWLYAQNGIGQLGYIPNNYVIKIDVRKQLKHLLWSLGMIIAVI